MLTPAGIKMFIGDKISENRAGQMGRGWGLGESRNSSRKERKEEKKRKRKWGVVTEMVFYLKRQEGE